MWFRFQNSQFEINFTNVFSTEVYFFTDDESCCCCFGMADADELDDWLLAAADLDEVDWWPATLEESLLL